MQRHIKLVFLGLIVGFVFGFLLPNLYIHLTLCTPADSATVCGQLHRIFGRLFEMNAWITVGTLIFTGIVTLLTTSYVNKKIRLKELKERQ